MGIKTSKDKKSKSKDKKDVDLKKKKKKVKDSERVERSPKKKKGEKKTRRKQEVEVRPIPDKLNRTALLDLLVDETAVDKKSVKKVLQGLEAVIKGSLIYKKGSGEFAFPGLFKIKTKFKPKKKGGEKVKNPFKPGEWMITKPKAASMKVKILPMKKLKDAAAIPSKE